MKQTNDPNSEDRETIPKNAFFILSGCVKVFPLEEAVITIGRRLDNDLVLDDPRVSRTHAQLRAIDGRYVIFDLHSTGGTFVNGEQITQCILSPGDLIWLAGVTLVYGEENPPPRLDLLDTNPPEDNDSDRPATSRRALPSNGKSKK